MQDRKEKTDKPKKIKIPEITGHFNPLERSIIKNVGTLGQCFNINKNNN